MRGRGERGIGRRAVLGAALLALVPWRGASAGEALAPDVAEAVRAAVGSGVPVETGITLRVPDTAENGASVPVTVTVESAMRGTDRCVSVHLFATANPTPGVASVHFGSLAARAEMSTRIRLAEGQRILAYAVMADGSVRHAAARVAVSTGGCLS